MSEFVGTELWPRIAADHDWSTQPPVDAEPLEAARVIVEDVRRRGEDALREHAERLGDLEGASLLRGPEELAAAFASLSSEEQALLERTAARIRAFAEAQLASLQTTEVQVPGGKAGSRWLPLARAGCYAPGGRYPLPSSVLMTVLTARVAGVAECWVASPRPGRITMAAAHVAGADALLGVGGAQAVAALAFGAGCVPRVDVIVGPGNAYVTAAKQLVMGQVRIDGLAGPSELVVLADADSDPGLIAADLLAQAEHDDLARPILVCTSSALEEGVRVALAEQLNGLATASTARSALRCGGSVVVDTLDEACDIVERIAPEHLELIGPECEARASRLRSYGGLFVGRESAEVLGDYGAGPNHVLPTGGSARYAQGLSVLDFVALRPWLELEDPREMARDAAALARLEGLEAHARAAELRLRG
jgi:phosphoribosyl-ATP pyrophosphohydrolase/phosphoribosyl-AMP cyclohydrolase/histidinol dehydrogenase